MSKFIKITYIDRINFFSDFYIKFYRNFFELNEFLFIVDSAHLNEISKYLFQKGFTNENIHIITAKKTYGYGERTGLQNEISNKYISNGHIVIYSDIDELIFHENLKEYILNNTNNSICPKGLFLIQNTNENYLDTEKSILLQRNFCKADLIWYSKVCILKKPYIWKPGRHNKEKGIVIDNNIFLIDIGRICKKMMFENNTISCRLYTNLTPRYSVLSLNEIESQYNELYKKDVILIPEVIKKSNFL